MTVDTLDSLLASALACREVVLRDELRAILGQIFVKTALTSIESLPDLNGTHGRLRFHLAGGPGFHLGYHRRAGVPPEIISCFALKLKRHTEGWQHLHEGSAEVVCEPGTTLDGKSVTVLAHGRQAIAAFLKAEEVKPFTYVLWNESVAQQFNAPETFFDIASGTVCSTTLWDWHEVAHSVLSDAGWPQTEALPLLREGMADLFHPHVRSAWGEAQPTLDELARLCGDERSFHGVEHSYTKCAKFCWAGLSGLGVEIFRKIFALAKTFPDLLSLLGEHGMPFAALLARMSSIGIPPYITPNGELCHDGSPSPL